MEQVDQSLHLISVVILARHGARSPKSLPPRLQNIEPVWNVKPGHLTEEGQEQQVLVGKFIAERYLTPLQIPATLESLQEGNIEMVCTQSQRTFDSATFMLRGMLQLDNADEAKQHIFVIPLQDDVYLKKHKHEVSRQLIRIRRNREQWLEKEEEQKSFLEQASYLFGATVRLSSVISMASMLKWQNIISYYLHYSSIPLPFTPGTVSAIYDLGDWVLRYKFMDEILEYYIIKDMMFLINKHLHKDRNKLACLCAHDSTLMAMLCYLCRDQIYRIPTPNFSSFIAFELYENEEEQLFIRVLYDNYVLYVRGEHEVMPIEDFNQLLMEPENYSEVINQVEEYLANKEKARVNGDEVSAENSEEQRILLLNCVEC